MSAGRGSVDGELSELLGNDAFGMLERDPSQSASSNIGGAALDAAYVSADTILEEQLRALNSLRITERWPLSKLKALKAALQDCSNNLKEIVRAQPEPKKFSQQIRAEKIRFMRVVDFILLGHSRAIVKGVLALAGALFAFWLTGGLALLANMTAVAATTTGTACIAAATGSAALTSAWVGKRLLSAIAYSLPRQWGLFKTRHKMEDNFDLLESTLRPKNRWVT